MKRFFFLLAVVISLSLLLASCKAADDGTTTSTATTTTTTTQNTSSTTSSGTDTTSTTISETPGYAYEMANGITINEVLGKSYGGILAPDGGDYDWIELYNDSSSTADISGWMLSNSELIPEKFVFPDGTKVPSHGFLLVWAVGKDYTTAQAGFYAPFKISASGETLVLSNPAGVAKEVLAVPAVDGAGTDVSYARMTDGSTDFLLCNASPKKTNNGTALRLPSDIITVSAESGFYDSEFDVSLSVPDGYTLKYTTDCSDPVSSKTAVTWHGEKVHIYDPSNEPVRYANINVQNNSGTKQWAPEQIDKCFVLRVAAVDAKGNSTEVLTRSYFVGFDEKDGYAGLPIICLTSDPDGLFSKNGGLFVLNYGESNWGANVHDTRDWERQTNFAMFSADGSYLFDQEVGIKVRGTSTRGAVQKSLNLYARSAYGNKEFVYPLFDTPSRSLVLRNDMVNNHHLGQGYLQDLVADRDLLTQRSITVLVFLEGEYYGIYTLYERFSENFVEDKYGVDDNNIWTAKKFAGSWGAEFDAPTTEGLVDCQKDLNDILVYIRDHDMAVDEYYDYVCSKIDMDSLIDLLCFQLYIGNIDFSLAQNISAWRAIETDTANPYADGRWRFVVYDLDISLKCNTSKKNSDVTSNPFTEDQPFAGPGFLGFDISTCYFKLSGETLVKDTSRRISYKFTEKMMRSPRFCEQFVRTMEDMGNFNFEIGRVKAMLDSQLEQILPVYPEYRKRMVQAAHDNTDPDVDEQLQNNLKSKYNTNLDYFTRRFGYIAQHMSDAFGLYGTRNNVRFVVKGVDSAMLRVNTSENSITKDGYNTKYYSDYDLSLTALDAPAGYAFDHWEIVGATLTGCTATDVSVTVTMNDNATVTVTAVYVPLA